MNFSISELLRTLKYDQENGTIYRDREAAKILIDDIYFLINKFVTKFPSNDLVLGSLWVGFLPHYPTTKNVVFQKRDNTIAISSKKARLLAKWILEMVSEE